MPPTEFLISVMAYRQLLECMGVKSIQIYIIPLHDLQLMPS